MSKGIAQRLTPDMVLKAAEENNFRYEATCRALGYAHKSFGLRHLVMKWGYRNWTDYIVRHGEKPYYPGENNAAFKPLWTGTLPEFVRLAERNDWNQTRMAEELGCNPAVIYNNMHRFGYTSWADFKEAQGQRPKLTLQRIYEAIKEVGSSSSAVAKHLDYIQKQGYGNSGAIIAYVMRNGYDSWTDYLERYHPPGQVEMFSDDIKMPKQKSTDPLVQAARDTGWQMDLVAWKMGLEDGNAVLKLVKEKGYADWHDFYERNS